jgi:5-methylcytosine-specific restriction endonuclease McrA
MICEYGCGNEATTQLKNKKWCCSSSCNKCPTLRKKNSESLIAGVKSRKIDYSQRYKNIPDNVKAKMNWNKGNYSGTKFEYNGTGNHKQVLILERGHTCESCNKKTWLKQQIVLELDHIDGDRKNNTRENLQLLCPNCHSMTKTWRGRNINSGKIKVDDDTLLTALTTEVSIRAALNKVGLTPKGGNYERCYKLLRFGGGTVYTGDLEKI